MTDIDTAEARFIYASGDPVVPYAVDYRPKPGGADNTARFQSATRARAFIAEVRAVGGFPLRPGYTEEATETARQIDDDFLPA